jgi:phosphoglycerol transferase
MTLLSLRRLPFKSVGVYLFTGLLSILLLFSIVGFKREALRLPYNYQGDAMFYHLLVKGMLDTGWILDNPFLGAPAKLDLRDSPSTDNHFYLLLLKAISWVLPKYQQILTAFFLLGFPLTAISALFVLRRFGVSRLVAVFASLLFTFLPYHFIRGQHHLFLSAYYVVPLAILITLWACRDEIGWREWKFPVSIAICLLLGSTGYYYAFFTCFFLVIAGAVAVLRTRRFSSLMAPALLILVIFGTTTLNFLPSITRFSDQGSAHFIRRQSGEADIYGLRIAQLLAPIKGHRVKALAELKEDYNMRQLINENDDASLGLIGGVGFLALMLRLLFRRVGGSFFETGACRELLDQLSVLMGAGVLLGTIGGVGSMAAFLLVPQVRAYNRVSVFLAFLALFAIALWIDQLSERYVRSKHTRLAVFGAAMGAVLLLGLLDQTSLRFRPNFRQIEDEFMNDEIFVKQIESTMPPDSMIFQLPVVSFPENPKVHKMNDYDLLRGYLHSRRLRWSYGSVKGRENDLWQRSIASQPTGELVETLVWAGFQGLYIDRFGYRDSGALLEKEVSAVVDAPPLVSPNQRMVFYDFQAYRRRLLDRTPPAEYAARRERALSPVIVVWRNGCYDQEGTLDNYWRWCGSKGTIELVNRTDRNLELNLETLLTADNGGDLKLTSPFFQEKLSIDRLGRLLSKSITLPPGQQFIEFECNAERILPPNDFRELVFQMRNFKLAIAEPAR